MALYSYAVIDLSLLLIPGVRFALNKTIKVDPIRIGSTLSSVNLKPPFEEDRDLSAIEITNERKCEMYFIDSFFT